MWQEWTHDDSQHQEAVRVQIHRLCQELLRRAITSSTSGEPSPRFHDGRRGVRCHNHQQQPGRQQSRLICWSRQWQEPPCLHRRAALQPKQCLDHWIQSSGVCIWIVFDVTEFACFRNMSWHFTATVSYWPHVAVRYGNAIAFIRLSVCPSIYLFLLNFWTEWHLTLTFHSV